MNPCLRSIGLAVLIAAARRGRSPDHGEGRLGARHRGPAKSQRRLHADYLGAGGKLLSVSTPVAGVAEVHEMSMEGTTMRMRAVGSLELPAGQAVELKPGGYHVMLMDLEAAAQRR